VLRIVLWSHGYIGCAVRFLGISHASEKVSVRNSAVMRIRVP
jgi:hypothetical protein